MRVLSQNYSGTHIILVTRASYFSSQLISHRLRAAKFSSRYLRSQFKSIRKKPLAVHLKPSSGMKLQKIALKSISHERNIRGFMTCKSKGNVCCLANLIMTFPHCMMSCGASAVVTVFAALIHELAKSRLRWLFMPHVNVFVLLLNRTGSTASHKPVFIFLLLFSYTSENDIFALCFRLRVRKE